MVWGVCRKGLIFSMVVVFGVVVMGGLVGSDHVLSALMGAEVCPDMLRLIVSVLLRGCHLVASHCLVRAEVALVHQSRYVRLRSQEGVRFGPR